MARNINLWKYKAYDANLKTVEGLIAGNDICQIALELRQQGLEMMELQRPSKLDIKLERMKRKAERLTGMHDPIIQRTQPRTLWQFIKRIFGF